MATRFTLKDANARWMAQAEYLAGELHRANQITPG